MSDDTGSSRLPCLCLKIGGRALENESSVKALALELADLGSAYRCILIHGGGAEVTRISQHFGLVPQFENGVRLTTCEEMRIVDMVLAGSVNTSLVRALGPRAVGLTGCDGGIFLGSRISPESYTGRVVETRPELLELLAGSGYLPVVSSVSADASGTPLNINADEAALAVAVSLRASHLVFVSDIPGILADGAVIRSMTPAQAEVAIAGEVITGGMIPKVRASAAALGAGVGAITIGSFEASGDLASFIAGTRGTSIVQEE